MENTQANYECAFLTIQDIKNYLNISQSAAYQLVKRKDFPVSRFSGCIRIPRDAFYAWVAARTYIPTALA